MHLSRMNEPTSISLADDRYSGPKISRSLKRERVANSCRKLTQTCTYLRRAFEESYRCLYTHIHEQDYEVDTTQI